MLLKELFTCFSMRRRWTFFWLFFFLQVGFSGALLQITEVMYAPLDGNEWVEIYNSGNESENLSLWKFTDAQQEDALVCCPFLPGCSLSLPPQSFAVITDKDTSFFPSNGMQICVDDSALGNGLGNEGDNLTLRTNSSSDYFSYHQSLLGYRNNKTLEKTSSGWRESLLPFGTPGRANQEPQSVPELPENTPPENTLPGNFSPCALTLDLTFPSPLFFTEKISFTLRVKNLTASSLNISVRGKIETPEGKVAKEYAPWSNRPLSSRLEKAYNPSLDAGLYLVSFWISNSSCTETEGPLQNITRLLAVLRSSEESDTNPSAGTSSLSIEEISLGKDNTAAWGESIPVKISLSKGDTLKTLVELKAKKAGKTVSETSKVYVPEKFSSLQATLPLQLRCSDADADAEVTVFLEGLGTKAERTFLVRGKGKRCENSPEDELFLEEEDAQDDTLSENISPSRLFSFHFQQVPQVVSERNFTFQVLLQNENLPHNYSLWSYLYRGSRCYSCAQQRQSREKNQQHFSLAAREEKMIDLTLSVDENAPPGEYKVKVKLRKDQQKTSKELISTVLLEGTPGKHHQSAEEKSTEEKASITGAATLPAPLQKSPQKNVFKKDTESKGITIYQAPEKKALDYLPSVLALAFALVIMVVVLKK